MFNTLYINQQSVSFFPKKFTLAGNGLIEKRSDKVQGRATGHLVGGLVSVAEASAPMRCWAGADLTGQ